MTRRNAIALGVQYDRETVRCEKCRLVQFVRTDERCRRCKVLFEQFDEEAEYKQRLAAALLIQVVSSETSKTTSRMGVRRIEIGFACWLIRQSLNLSQRELALRMMCPRTFISKIESNLTEVRIDTLERMSKALEVPVEYIVRIATLRSVTDVLNGK